MKMHGPSYKIVRSVYLSAWNMYPTGWNFVKLVFENLYKFLSRKIDCLYNEPTNAQLIDSLLLFYILLLLHVSTLMRHPQGALIRCLLSYINVLMQSWWCLLKKLTYPLPTIVKTLKTLKTVLGIINKLHCRNNSRESLPGGRIYSLCTDSDAMMAWHILSRQRIRAP
jgi:hypothetical protein